jgi:hypothetical protein
MRSSSADIVSGCECGGERSEAEAERATTRRVEKCTNAREDRSRRSSAEYFDEDGGCSESDSAN